MDGPKKEQIKKIRVSKHWDTNTNSGRFDIYFSKISVVSVRFDSEMLTHTPMKPEISWGAVGSVDVRDAKRFTRCMVAATMFAKCNLREIGKFPEEFEI